MLWPFGMLSFVNILHMMSCIKSCFGAQVLILYAAPCVCVCVWTLSGCNWFHNVELMQRFFFSVSHLNGSTEDYGQDYFPGKSLSHIPWCFYHFWTSVFKAMPLRHVQRVQTQTPILFLEPTSSRFALSRWSVQRIQVHLLHAPPAWLLALCKNSLLCVESLL